MEFQGRWNSLEILYNDIFAGDTKLFYIYSTLSLVGLASHPINFPFLHPSFPRHLSKVCFLIEWVIFIPPRALLTKKTGATEGRSEPSCRQAETDIWRYITRFDDESPKGIYKDIFLGLMMTLLEEYMKIYF